MVQEKKYTVQTRRKYARDWLWAAYASSEEEARALVEGLISGVVSNEDLYRRTVMAVRILNPLGAVVEEFAVADRGRK